MTIGESPLNVRLQPLDVQRVSPADTSASKPTLRLLSINLAHGRKQNFHQALLSEADIRNHLQSIAQYLSASEADVVALQEADGASNWSGNFNHVEMLAQQGSFASFVQTEHVNNLLGNYGTGILSKIALQEGLGFTFQPSPPTPQKGFTLAQLRWQPDMLSEPKIIDVVSVHLDFSRDSIRQAQIDEIKAVLAPRKNSIIIMGDFNSEFLAPDYVVKLFTEGSALHAYEFGSDQFKTYGNKRLDWIFMSRDLEFLSYRVDDAHLSDHRVVIADIKLVDQ